MEKSAYFLPNAIVNILIPIERDLLERQHSLIKVNFTISASTSLDEYKCRKIDWNSINTNINNDDQDIIKYINENRTFTCPNGKYPHIEFEKCLEYIDSNVNEWGE